MNKLSSSVYSQGWWQVFLGIIELIVIIIIGSGNGLLPVQHQVITWINSGLLWTGPSGIKHETFIAQNLFENFVYLISAIVFGPHCANVSCFKFGY